jgi:serine/threonine protein kinase
MAVSSLKQMLDRLLETGLISHEQFQELGGRKNPEDTLPSVAGVARRLVDKGVLTQFQASHISDGNPERLVVDDYVLVEMLGSGGMGEVYLARHRIMQRYVAIKLLVPRSAERIESIERFKREARAAAKLSHPNIVTALDAGIYNGQYYLVMEYVKGQSLGDIVKTQGAVRLNRALDLTIQAGQGIEYAHRQGVIHRDIKPSNLLLSDDGTVKVTDLGLSRVLQPDRNLTGGSEGEDELTSSGMIMGTVDFMAPEQAMTPRDADERADIYGLGCTLYFLLTGHAVFVGDTPMARLIAHRETPVPEITEALPNAPRRLDRILKRMLAKDPDNRYQTIGEALRELRSCLHEFQDGLSDLPETEFRSEEQVAGSGRAKSSVARALAVLAVAIVAIGFLLNSNRPPDVVSQQESQPEIAPDVASDSSNPEKPQEIVIINADSEPVNVLEILDLKNARFEGENWSIDQQTRLVTGVHPGDGERRALLALPVEVCDSFWMTLDLRRLPVDSHVKGPLVIGLPVGTSACLAAFDAHRESGARVSFLDSKRGAERQTTLASSKFLRIREDDTVTVRIEVTVQEPGLAKVRAGIDDIEPMEWQGDPAEIEIGNGWAPAWPVQLFVGSLQRTQYEIRNLWIGPGALPVPEEPAEAPSNVSAGDGHSDADGSAETDRP